MILNKEITLPKINRVEIEGRRFYNKGELFYPSITTVLSHFPDKKLLEWEKAVGEEEATKIKRLAAARGNIIHDAAEQYILTGTIPKVPIIYELPTIQLCNSIDKSLTKPYCTEEYLFSEHLKVAGTVDLVGFWDRKRSAVDFKGSNKSKDKGSIINYFLQTTSYAIMFEECTGIPVPNIVIVIAVEDDEKIQVFKGKRDDYAPKLLETINHYYKEFHDVS